MEKAESLRILVVEDEALITMMLEDMLAGLGHAVVGPAATLEQAITIASANIEAIDAALLDVNLQGASCYPVAELLKERDIPFVFTTGQDEMAWEGAPEAPVLAKPYTDDQLAEVLARATRRIR